MFDPSSSRPGDDSTDEPRDDEAGATTSRRRVLAAGGVAGIASLSGCLSSVLGTDTETGDLTMEDFRGSGALVDSRPEIDAPSIDDLPDLSGELTVYVGTGEGGLYEQLLTMLDRKYSDFNPEPRSGKAASQANTIITEMEGDGSPADVFWSVDAGPLGAVADEGYTVQLPAEDVSSVPENFRPDREWVGTAGRARAIPYNTDELSAADLPDSVAEFPDLDRFENAMAWAPSYSSFVSFVTVMRLLRGRDPTKQWLAGMQSRAEEKYSDEFFVSEAVADGSVLAGFANHYYAMRVKSERPDAPIDLAFTSGDAGALINAAGVGIIEGSDDETLARQFVRHLLSAEVQEYFATRAYAYPMVEGVDPVGGLPPIDDLKPPDVSLQELSDVDPTLELMREAGVIS